MLYLSANISICYLQMLTYSLHIQYLLRFFNCMPLDWHCQTFCSIKYCVTKSIAKLPKFFIQLPLYFPFIQNSRHTSPLQSASFQPKFCQSCLSQSHDHFEGGGGTGGGPAGLVVFYPGGSFSLLYIQEPRMWIGLVSSVIFSVYPKLQNFHQRLHFSKVLQFICFCSFPTYMYAWIAFFD